MKRILEHSNFGGMDFQWRNVNLSGVIKNIFICDSEMNASHGFGTKMNDIFHLGLNHPFFITSQTFIVICNY